MPTTPAQCVNYELNLLMCPCTSDSCAHRGICCECIAASYADGNPTACMAGALRRPETMDLSERAQAVCPTNQARNAEFCTCGSQSCARRGVCCNCVRTHFTLDGTGRTACMRGLG